VPFLGDRLIGIHQLSKQRVQPYRTKPGPAGSRLDLRDAQKCPERLEDLVGMRDGIVERGPEPVRCLLTPLRQFQTLPQPRQRRPQVAGGAGGVVSGVVNTVTGLTGGAAGGTTAGGLGGLVKTVTTTVTGLTGGAAAGTTTGAVTGLLTTTVTTVKKTVP
jgi:hypothetical protein